jgi:hypothetical protein
MAAHYFPMGPQLIQTFCDSRTTIVIGSVIHESPGVFVQTNVFAEFE